ncbi:UNVERIFIED_CONTAM: hypothetical protein FKN15_071266 [Acipenser sinensis]
MFLTGRACPNGKPLLSQHHINILLFFQALNNPKSSEAGAAEVGENLPEPKNQKTAQEPVLKGRRDCSYALFLEQGSMKHFVNCMDCWLGTLLDLRMVSEFKQTPAGMAFVLQGLEVCRQPLPGSWV